MNSKQKEFVSKTLADIGKGLLLAVAVGTLTGRITLLPAVMCLGVAAYSFVFTYRLEGQHGDNNAS